MNLFERISLPEFAIEYLNHLEQKGRKASTVEKYFYDLHMFFEWFKKEYLTEIRFDVWRQLNEETYREFFNYLAIEKGYSDRTLHRIFTVLKRMAIYYNSINKKTNIPEINKRLLDYQGKTLTSEDFVSKLEFDRLVETILSPVGLSERQLEHRHMIVDRNLSIVYMMYYEGLTLNEIYSLEMKEFNFVRNTIEVYTGNNKRMLEIPNDRMKLYYDYYMTIPEILRPKWHSNEPFFCAFHFIMGRYKYVYDDNKKPLYPKRISEVAIQRMIRKEIKRGKLRESISGQHLRNTSILNAIIEGKSKEEIMKRFGFKKELSLKRYLEYAAQLSRK